MYDPILNESAAGKYYDYFLNLFKVKPTIFMEESLIKGLPGVSAFVFKNFPVEGTITAVTYGLSLVKHPDWKFGRPELYISVDSTDIRWGRVAAYIANKLRGDCPFSYGQVINFKQLISDDSEMDAFFIFTPSVEDKEPYSNIDIGLDYKINLQGFYPMYSDEVDTYHKIGLKEFWHHPNFNLFSVNRPRIK